MGNVLSLLLGIMSDPDKKPDEIEVTTGDEALESGFGSELVGILGWVFLAFGALALLWAIYIGFVFATADDANKRAEAKKRLFNALSVMLIVVALTGILQLIKVGITSIDTKNNGTNVEIKEYSPEGGYPRENNTITFTRGGVYQYVADFPTYVMDSKKHLFAVTNARDGGIGIGHLTYTDSPEWTVDHINPHSTYTQIKTQAYPVSYVYQGSIAANALCSCNISSITLLLNISYMKKGTQIDLKNTPVIFSVAYSKPYIMDEDIPVYNSRFHTVNNPAPSNL